MKIKFEKERGFAKIVPMPNEIENVRKKAREDGHDPDVAEVAFLEKLNGASARLNPNSN